MWRKRNASSPTKLGLIGADQVAPDQRRQARARAPAPARPGVEGIKRSAVEHRALHGGVREQRPLVVGQTPRGAPQAGHGSWAGPAGRPTRRRPSSGRPRGGAGRRRSASPRSSSAKSGLPSVASAIRAAASGGRVARLRRFAISSRVSSSPSGSSRIEVAFSLPPPQPGRASSSSGRAMHSSMIGASRDRSATCSTRSRNVGSAHWRSSNTTTSGRRRATASNSRRAAQKISSLVPPSGPPNPTASATPAAIWSAFGSPASCAAMAGADDLGAAPASYPSRPRPAASR